MTDINFDFFAIKIYNNFNCKFYNNNLNYNNGIGFKMNYIKFSLN